MKVLYLIHRYPPAQGGSERYVQEMARRLVADGHQATVYTSNVMYMDAFWCRSGRGRMAAGVEDDAGVVVRRFKARVLPLHGATSRLLGQVPWSPIGLTMAPPGLVLPGLWQAVRQRGDWDLVHASAYPSLMYLGSVAARRSGAGLVLMPCTHPGVAEADTRHSDFITPRLARLYRQAGALLPLTQREQQLLIGAGVPTERTFVAGAGSNPEEAAGADADRFREAFGLASDTAIVSFVGHKTPGKGALILLDACQALVAERPNITFILVGASTPAFAKRYAALPQSVKARTLSLSLSEQEKHDLLAASSVLVLPSRDDSFGIVLLEAWLHGKSVIAARSGGLPDVIEDGRTGLLVPWGDAATLAETIAWILDHPEESARMGDRGRRRTLEQWTWDAVYRRVRTAYEECLAP